MNIASLAVGWQGASSTNAANLMSVQCSNQKLTLLPNRRNIWSEMLCHLQFRCFPSAYVQVFKGQAAASTSQRTPL